MLIRFASRGFNVRIISLAAAVSIVLGGLTSAGQIGAADPPSTVGPLLGLLQRGTLPAERIPNVAKLICERGNEHDLAFIFSQVVEGNWSPELKRDALQWLRDAAATRKVRPAGDLDGLATLIDADHNPELRRDAVQLAAVWKPASAVPPLQKMAHQPDTDESLRSTALSALIAYGGDVARKTIEELLAPSQSLSRQVQGVAALTRRDLPRASQAAARLLQTLGEHDDPAPLVDPFLQVPQGADQLATAIRSQPPSAETALLSLRHIYAVGRSDPALDSVLSELAGIKGEVPKLSEDEIKSKAEQATSAGDATRGELVFRRADLACMRCHAVSKAGGQIGPDLSALGVSSPVDYIVKSVYDPDAQKKEEFVTRILLTNAGQQLTGIVTNRTEDKLTLKLADGSLTDVAAADIDYEAPGRSLMPEGLVKFMTEQELLDLVKFLSTLGKPGTPYAIRATQRMQRWRVLKSPAPTAIELVPDEQALGDLVLRADGWEAAYSQVNGDLPLSELVQRTGQTVVYLQGEAEVTKAGPVEVQLQPHAGVTLWIDGNSVALDGPTIRDLAVGRHTLTLRVDTTATDAPAVQLSLTRPSGSTAQFAVADGQ
ncbi:MAG: HEAT repeat domain-containing protein [Planctomycetaceae bacterium]